MMMCEQPLMDLERPFLDLLAGTTRFEFATGGELLLHAQDERTLRARRTTP
jgi:heat shock protein HslJ